MTDYVEVFSQSFDRSVKKGNESSNFFDRFYAIFTAKSVQVKEKFDKVPPERRNPMVRESLTELMNFYATGQASDYMCKIAQMHDQQHANIPPKMYSWWLDSLMQTVEEFDPEFNEDVDSAWRMIVSPGIAFMTRQWPGMDVEGFA